MARRRSLLARLEQVTATPLADARNAEAVSGVALVFRPEGNYRGISRIDRILQGLAEIRASPTVVENLRTHPYGIVNGSNRIGHAS